MAVLSNAYYPCRNRERCPSAANFDPGTGGIRAGTGVSGRTRAVSGRSNSATRASPVRMFRIQNDWAAWLEKNHRKSDGLWLRLAKRASAVQSVTHGQALAVALCYGWIDGQENSDTDQTWMQQFCPRSHQSIWSRINRGKALTLIESGIMRPAVLEAVERAKEDGCWRNA